MNRYALGAPEGHEHAGFGDLFQEFDRPRPLDYDDWGGRVVHEEPFDVFIPGVKVATPVHTDFHDAYFIVKRARWLRNARIHGSGIWSEPDVTALTRFYGGTLIGSYKSALVAFAARSEMVPRTIVDDYFDVALPDQTIEFKYALPAPAPSVPVPTTEMRERFENLVRAWLDETGASSMLTDKVLHPAYQQIIGLGEPGLRLVLEQLEEEPGHWFWALGSMAPKGENPAVDAESVAAARELWLAWGREKGYLPDPS